MPGVTHKERAPDSSSSLIGNCLTWPPSESGTVPVPLVDLNFSVASVNYSFLIRKVPQTNQKKAQSIRKRVISHPDCIHRALVQLKAN
jgi:hypothetical protein